MIHTIKGADGIGNPLAHVPFILQTVHEQLLTNSTSRILQECGQEVERQLLVLIQVGQAAHQIGGGGVTVFFVEGYDGRVKAVNQPQELITCTNYGQLSNFTPGKPRRQIPYGGATVHPVMISSMGGIRFSQEKYTVSS